jgi:methionyl-tRNA formyltransferase
MVGTNSINFHPAMLPQNRGWYPHVFNILNGSKAGVTLHVINKGADTGPIWAQREIKVLDEDTSDTLYFRLQDEIYQLFIETWPKILNKEIEPKEQDETNATYNSINDVEKFNEIKLDKNYSGKELINILRARTFGESGYAYFINNENKRVNIRIKLY